MSWKSHPLSTFNIVGLGTMLGYTETQRSDDPVRRASGRQEETPNPKLSGSVLQEQLLNFFTENGITVYPSDKVCADMNALAGPERIWCWKPLFTASIGKLIDVTNPCSVRKNGWISNQQYQHEVLPSVLLIVNKIAERFKESVHFYVSDFEPINPSPFLGVFGLGIIILVIERWDEPTCQL